MKTHKFNILGDVDKKYRIQNNNEIFINMNEKLAIIREQDSIMIKQVKKHS